MAEKLICNKGLEIRALKANIAYIGTLVESGEDRGLPNCRCSADYYKTQEEAQKALDDRTFKVRRCMENDFCNEGCGCFGGRN